MANNPRRTNSHARNELRRWLAKQERPCWICAAFGKPAAIDYSLPPRHPLSFEVDELTPVSLGGDPLDRLNVDAAHRCCNQWRGNKSVREVLELAAEFRRAKQASTRPSVPPQADGSSSIEWL